jgi:ribonuclease Z
MRIVILGTSAPGSAIRPGHAGTGVVVTQADAHILLDCGPGVTKRLASCGIDLRQIPHVLITHHHWDHITDLPVFVLGRWERSMYGSAKGEPLAPAVHVLGPPPTRRIVAQLFSDAGVYGPDIQTRTSLDMGQPVYAGVGAAIPFDGPFPRADDIEPGVVLTTDAFRVTAAEAQHTQPYLRSLAYRLESEDGAVVFSGDTAPCESVIELARRADVLLHEGAMAEEFRQQAALQTIHTSSTTVGRVAAEASVRKLVVIHHHLDPSDNAARTALVEEIGKDFSGDIQIAREFDEITV